jgi:leader peptidase (prepilin peptidase)/N-methyltransferase
VPAIAAFPAGLLLGSFVTVLAYRVPRHESFVTGRSRCPGCGAQIAAYDNIPVVSWLLLQGRCRSCGDRISARYPLAELSLGLLYLGTVLVLGTGDAGKLALGLVLCTLLVAVTLTDLERRIIPNALVIAGVIVAIPLLAIADPGALPSHLIAAAVAGGLLFLIALAYPRGMGMGDVKLVMMMGLYLGRSVAPALLVAFAAGALVGLAMIARHGSDARKSAIPFGPFLASGGVVGLWFGDAMASWYLDTFTGG